MQSGLRVTTKIGGIAEVLKALRKTEQAKDLGQVIGKSIVAGVRRVFDDSVDPETGAQWAPLKARVGKPLVDTGKLRRSIVYLVHRRGVRIGTNFAWAKVHQYGRRNIVPKRAKMLAFMAFGQLVFAKRVDIPQRRFLPETDRGVRNVTHGTLMTEVENYLKKISKEGGNAGS